jgi:hypothetical protein
MCLHNIIRQRQSQTRALACWLGSEERLKYFVFNRVGDAGAVVGDGDLDTFIFTLFTPGPLYVCILKINGFKINK